MRARISRICLVPGLTAVSVATSVFLISGFAWANHQNWELQDQATACVPTYSTAVGGTDLDRLQHFYGANNAGSDYVEVMCPVNLSGQFAGTNSSGGGVIKVHATIPTLGAFVHYYNGNQQGLSIECAAVAASDTGALYYSGWQSNDTSQTGPGVLQIATTHNWGSTLGDGLMNVPIRSLAYDCYIPPYDPVTYEQSAVISFRTVICSNHDNCSAFDPKVEPVFP